LRWVPVQLFQLSFQLSGAMWKLATTGAHEK